MNDAPVDFDAIALSAAIGARRDKSGASLRNAFVRLAVLEAIDDEPELLEVRLSWFKQAADYPSLDAKARLLVRRMCSTARAVASGWHLLGQTFSVTFAKGPCCRRRRSV